jgi:hypothetical protein
MQKSYVAKTTINYVDFNFYVRPGDLLVHDTANQNRLTVHRNGQIVKVVKQDPLGLVAFLKNNFITEVDNTPKVQPVVPAVEKKAAEPEPIRPSKEELALKRRKAQPEEVSVDSLPSHLQEMLASRKTQTDETTVDTKVEK